MMTLEKKSKQNIVNEYIEKYNLYEKTENLGYNIAKISRYAKEKGCSIVQLTG